MVQKVATKREFEAGLRHATTGTLSVNPAVNGYLFQDKAVEGEGWAPPFIILAQNTVGL